jgi:hydrogenase maturation factor HypF (carbamoyltransferase family)
LNVKKVRNQTCYQIQRSMMNEEVKQKSWFKRNWIWVVPVSGCLTLVVLAALGIGSLFYGVTKVMTNSEPSEYAMELTQNSAEVVIAIGDNIQKDGMTGGSVSYNNGLSKANLQIPIEGSKNRATIIVKAHKEDDQWIYEELYVLIKESQEQINLLNKTLDDF